MPGGRPTRYNKTFHPALVRALAQTGRTDEQMADEMGIARSTFYKWKIEKKAFSDSIKAGKNTPDELVEGALFQRAVGFKHADEKIFMTKDGDIVRAETIKKYPPDPASMIFYLKNRRPERWRDKQTVEHEIGDKARIVFTLPDNGRGPDNADGDS